MERGFRGEQFAKDTKPRVTPEKLQKGMDKAIDLFCNEFIVEGKEEVEAALKENPDAKFVIASSHFSNLDAPAAVTALGDKLNIQITAESVLFKGLMPQRMLFSLAGKDSFTPLSYEKDKKGKHGVFNPEDFSGLAQLVEQGKTPWIAVHPFTTEEKMQTARIGAVYLAHKSDAMIIPTALDYQGGSVSAEGPKELIKAIAGRKEATGTYHVGHPIKLLPLDVSIIETVMGKRSKGEQVNPEEKSEFLQVMKRLREDADTVAHKIGSMLPPERRGPYQDISEVELTEEDVEFINE